MTFREFLVRPGLLLLFTLCWTLAAQAQEPASAVRYISDETAITLRQDKGMNAPVAALLKSGTRVEMIEDDKPSGYARVRVAPGREGWVLSRYLSNEPAARERLAAVQSQFADQQALVRRLEAENARLRAAGSRSSDTASAVPVADSAASGAPVAEDQEEGPKRSSGMHEVVSMVTGAGLFVAGLLAGLLVPLIPRGGRRSRWSADL